MEVIRNITFIACFISIVISMLDIVTPDGKFKKQVRLVFALVFIIAVMNPILHSKIDLSDFKAEDIKQTAQYKMVNETFYNSLSENYTENLKKSLTQKLNVNNISPREIAINVNISKDNCIDINEVKIVLALKDKNKQDTVVSIVKNEIGNYPVKITCSED